MSEPKKILLIGSKGMAGHVLYHYLKEHTGYTIVDIARDSDMFEPTYKLDVTRFNELKAVFEKESPNVVINCIGVLNKDAEDNPDKAILLNSYLPHFIASAGAELGFKLIHISTDCVFNGKRGNYKVDDIKDGTGFYAQSKALGEVAYGNNITIRTSIIGPELKNGIGLFHWFMSQTGEVKGYTQAFWTGVTTIELAKAIAAVIEKNPKGLYHLVYKDKINKYDLIQLFKTVFEREDISIVPFDGYYVDKSLVKDDTNFSYEVPAYKQMIEEMKEWMLAHKQLYKY